MRKAIIFDLDGTLVQTEILKARSYAKAAVEVSSRPLSQAQVIEAFKRVVGHSRQEVARHIVETFQLAPALQHFKQKQGLAGEILQPWQVLVQIRLNIYQQMLSDREILQKHLCPFNVALLKKARAEGLKTGLATMSHCQQAMGILAKLALHTLLDFIATRDDVENGKPDPEIYQIVARELGVAPAECLVVEDSVAGMKAALAAGMRCIVVTTDFTREAVHASHLLDPQWIVDDPAHLMRVAERAINDQ